MIEMNTEAVAAEQLAQHGAPEAHNPLGVGRLADTLKASGLLGLPKGATPEAIQSALGNLNELATGSEPTELVFLRRGAVDTLKDKDKVGMGHHDATALVSAVLPKEGKVRGEAKELHGHAIALTDPEPWPDPVTGDEVLAQLVRTLTHYLSLSTGAATTIALWILFAHAHDAFQISPILAITSPEKRCGKTTLMELISSLVRRPLPSSSITAPSLFRTVDQFKPTLLIDEADTFLKDKEDLRGILNSGHRRTLAVIVRTVGDQHEPRLFSTWAAKAIALIGKLPDTLADRSIEVRMRRRTVDEHVERLRLDRLGELEPLRRRLWTWAQDNLEELRVDDPSLPDSLHDRAMDNWRSLVSIADLVGGVWPERARRAALLLSGEVPDDEESLSTLLLGDIRELFESKDTNRLASTQIVIELGRREERPWPEFRNGSQITVRQVARLLKRFDIRPTVKRIDGKSQRGYELADFQDAFHRYLPGSQPSHPLQPNDDATDSGFPIRNADPLVTDGESGERPANKRDVTDVTDGNTPSAEDNGEAPVLGFFSDLPTKEMATTEDGEL